MDGPELRPPPDPSPGAASAGRSRSGRSPGTSASAQVAPTGGPAERASRPAGAPRQPPPPAGAPRVPWRPAVPHDVAAVVIGRAAELEHEGGAGGGAGLDEQAIVEIGRDVGLTPAVVRQALDEYHAGLLRTSPPDQQTVVGPRLLVIERTVPGPIGRVRAELEGFLEGKLFDCCRRAGYRSVWRPREGLIATIQRAGKRLSRDRTLDDVTEITVELVELPGAQGQAPGVRLRLEVECRALRRGLVATTLGGVGAGGAGALAAAGAAITMGDPTPLLGVPPLGALAAGAYLGPRSVYRRKLAEVELILQGGLDDLVERGVGALPGRAPR
jgi:hypothetical protein